MSTEPDYDERFITLEEAERLAHSTGEYDGREVTFSNDGETWTEFWLPTPEHQFPVLARVAVYRKSITRPTVVVVSWSEYYPDDEDRRASWDKLKTVLLAKVGVVSALRSAFRDVIGGRHERAELDQASRAAAIPGWWLDDAEKALTLDGVQSLRASAIAQKFMGDEVDRVLKLRLAKIQSEQVEEFVPPPIAEVAAEVKARKPKLATGGTVALGGQVVINEPTRRIPTPAEIVARQAVRS